ncbi:MAG: aromatic ring-hydroxylating dioxygenase subunit alpha [Dongiaceae bacterium]
MLRDNRRDGNGARFANVFKPLLQAETLPPAAYTSQAFYDAELKHLFARTWNFFGHESRIPNPGDFFTETFLGVPLLFVRNRGGQVKTFANSCRHRGTRVAKGAGNCRGFRCPYHFWNYDLDGRLRGAVGMDQTQEFDAEEYGLIEFETQCRCGFIFVRLGEEAGSVDAHLGDMPEQLAAYRCENLVLADRVEFDVACNWKNHIENSVEDFHVPMVHSTTLNKLEGGYEHFSPETRGNWLVMRERHAGTRALLNEDVRHALPRIPGLYGHAAEGTNFVCLFPSTLIALTVDCVWYVELSPQGPHRTRVTLGGCFPRESMAEADFAERAAYYFKRWKIAVSEDNDITEQQLLGLKSPFAQPGRLSHLEPLIPQMAAWWVSKMMESTNALPLDPDEAALPGDLRACSHPV